MKKLALVRYGEHIDGHLNEQGKEAMILASGHLQSLVQGKKVCIICAQISRAIESAKIISKSLKVFPVKSFKELYAAEEDGIMVDLKAAVKVIDSASKGNDVVIAVISREYVETLPSYILNTLDVQEVKNIKLGRGEILILDYDKKNIIYLK